MVSLSPVGLATTALVANQVSLLATFKEKLCRPFCINSTVQPQVTVVYTTGSPTLNGTTVFVPITAVITIVTPNCGCNANTKLFTENFVAAFQGQTDLPTAVTVTSEGRTQGGSNVVCGKAHSYTINDSLTVAITT